MAAKVRLFIQNLEVELKNDIQLAITKQFADLSNPTNIVTDWSKTVSIPASTNNNKLFGNIFRDDRSISKGSDYVGINFDPNKKLDMTLYYNDDVLLKGYAKFLQVKRNKTQVTYEMSLFSELGRVFKEMLKITFDPSETDDGYLIDGAKYFKKVINKDLVKYAFENPRTVQVPDLTRPITDRLDLSWVPEIDAKKYADAGVKDTGLKFTGNINDYDKVFNLQFLIPSEIFKQDTGILAPSRQQAIEALAPSRGKASIPSLQENWIENGWHYFIGFAPHEGYSEDFDYKTVQMTNQLTREFKEILDEHWSASGFNGIDAESLVGDGLLPRAYGEYRSYYQQPYWYFDSFFSIFATKVKEITGYSLKINLKNTKLADDFHKLVFLGKPLYTSDEYSKEQHNLKNHYISWTGSDNVGYVADPIIYQVNSSRGGTYYYNGAQHWDENPDIPDIDLFTFLFENNNSEIYDPDNNRILLSEDHDVMVENVLPLGLLFAQAQSGEVRLKPKAMMNVMITFVGENGHFERVDNNIFDENTELLTETNEKYYDNVIRIGAAEDVVWTPMKPQTKKIAFNVNVSKKLKYSEFGKWVQMYYSYWFYEEGATKNRNWIPFTKVNADTSMYMGFFKDAQLSVSKQFGSKRSGDYFTLNNLWDNTYKPFDILLNFTKMLGLVWTMDEESKVISIIDRNEYFKKGYEEKGLIDWNGKIDYAQDYSISPVSYGHRYMNFNYDENETTSGQAYAQEYGVEYGGIKVNTSYEFDSETEDMFEGLKSSIIFTPTVMDWNHMYDQRWIYIGTDDQMVYLYDEDKKSVNGFGEFFFELEKKAFDKNARLVYISDDTDLMETTDTYVYLNTNINVDGVLTPCSKYSKLDIVDSTGEATLLFNVPMKSYDTTNNYKKVAHSVYTDYWHSYINERYNNSNKVVTCYVRLTFEDYKNVDFNNFITINDQIYVLNKVYDYDPNKLFTKVDLISVSSIRAYTDTIYSPPEPEPEPEPEDILRISDTWSYVGYEKDETIALAMIESISDVTFNDGTKRIEDAELGISIYITDDMKLMLHTDEVFSSDIDVERSYTLVNQSEKSVTYKVIRYSVWPVMTVNANVSKLTNTQEFDIIITLGMTDTYDEDRTPTYTITWANNPSTASVIKSRDWSTYMGEYYPEGPEGSSVTTQIWETTFKFTSGQTENNTLNIEFTTYEGFKRKLSIPVAVPSTLYASHSAGAWQYVPGDISNETYGPITYIYSNDPIGIFAPPMLEFSTPNGIKLMVVKEDTTMLDGTYYNYSIYYKKESYYNEPTDNSYSFIINNGHKQAPAYKITRYNDYPNPAELLSFYAVDNITGAQSKANYIPALSGRGSVTIEIKTQYKPIGFSSGASRLCSFTMTSDWEYHNDDYVYYSATFNYVNNNISTDRTDTITVTTGSGAAISHSYTIGGRSIGVRPAQI